MPQIIAGLQFSLFYACFILGCSKLVYGRPDLAFQLGDALYYARYSAWKSSISFDIPDPLPSLPAGYIPATSIRTNLSLIRAEDLGSIVDHYAAVDDVWSDLFLEGLVIEYDGPSDAFLDTSALRWIANKNITKLYLSRVRTEGVPLGLTISRLSTALSPGPCLLSSSQSHEPVLEVYRLFADHQEAFIFGTIPFKDTWIEAQITGRNKDGKATLYIPAPSRLSFIDTGLPLSRQRFALKDIFDVAGLHTYAGSVAYGETRPLPVHTAPSVQRLLDLGAMLVGKTKTSQFAHGANPWDFIDFGYPWNPRGDGYLTASSSSSGSACAIAAYSWIDFAVGSDTRGSVRKPASLVGAYGIRPSFGAITLEGVLPLAEKMDTAGLFARDPLLLHTLAEHWYPGASATLQTTSSMLPRRLLYPTDHFPVTNPVAQRIFDEFVMRVSALFDITVVPIDVTANLLPLFPKSNFTQFQVLSNVLAEYHSYTSVAQPLISAYQAIHGTSSLPPLDTIPQRIFARAQHFTTADYALAVEFQQEFTRAVSEHILTPDTASCSQSIMVYDIGFGGVPSYRLQALNQLDGARDLPLNSPWEMSDVADGLNYLASAAGLPEVTVPIGQAPYRSHVTGKIEMLPVSLQLVAHSGCDLTLMNFVRALSARDALQAVKVGNRAF